MDDSVFDDLKVMMKSVLNQDELFTLGAKLIRKSYNALIDEGFSMEEAIQIVAAQGSVVKSNG